MLVLIWGLLNISAFFYFIFICFKVLKLARQELGIFPKAVLVIGLLSFFSQSSKDDENKEPNSKHFKIWNFPAKDSLKSYKPGDIDIDLEKTMVSTCRLYIQYTKKEGSSLIIPVSATSSCSGFISGTTWKPSFITVDTTAVANKLRYSVSGTVEWKLLGLSLYREGKEYSGTTPFITPAAEFN